MKKQDTKGADEGPPGPTPEDQAFERELVAKHPGRKISRYEMPASVEEARAVYMFKLKNKDDLTAAEMAEATMTDGERKNGARIADAQRREAIRLSIVGLLYADVNGNVTRQLVDQARPLMEIDDWDSSAWIALRSFFGDLNGLPTEELGNAVRGARRVGASAPSAATARP